MHCHIVILTCWSCHLQGTHHLIDSRVGKHKLFFLHKKEEKSIPAKLAGICWNLWLRKTFCLV